MTDEYKQSREYKSIRKGLLIGGIIVIIILISYFTLTDIPLSDSDSLKEILLKKKLTGNSYSWKNLFFILAGIAALPLCYLATTKKLKGICNKLIGGYRLFKSPIQLHEEIKDIAIILAVSAAFALFFKGLYDNCCDWWSILFTRLSFPAEPLNFRNVLIGVAGVVTLVFAGWRTYIANQTRILDKSRRFDERFDGAAEALSKKLNESSFPSHLGAISSLRALAIDSSENTQRCLDIICSCNEWMEEYINEFIEKRSKEAYSFWPLKENNRIANKNKEAKTTLLHEKRSQHALTAVSDALEEIFAKRPEQLKRLKFHNKMLCGISLDDLKLDNINLKNTCLVAAFLNKTSLSEANLSKANLQSASLDEINLQNASLDYVNLKDASLVAANLKDTSLVAANLQGTSLMYVNLKRAFLDGAKLQKALLYSAKLEEVSLDNANLQGADLDNANLQGASLGNANLQGVSLNNANLQNTYLMGTGLEGTVLSHTNLQEALLINTKLQGAIMDNVDLSNAILWNCNLYGVTLKDINSKNIVFNDIANVADIAYINNKHARKRLLDDVCQYIKTDKIEFFTQQMERAWQAMEKNQEPDGLEIIEKNSIVNRDDPDMYDISEEDLANLQKRLQELVSEKGIIYLDRIKYGIASLSQTAISNIFSATELSNRDIPINKNVNLVNKLRDLVDELIKNNQPQKNK